MTDTKIEDVRNMYRTRFKLLPFACTQLFQPLGEMLSYYNGNWFSSHHFGFRSSGKLKFGLNTHMT